MFTQRRTLDKKSKVVILYIIFLKIYDVCLDTGPSIVVGYSKFIRVLAFGLDGLNIYLWKQFFIYSFHFQAT